MMEKNFGLRPLKFSPPAWEQKSQNGRHAAMKFRKMKFFFDQNSLEGVGSLTVSLKGNVLDDLTV
jgi:hypothetical protein